MRNRKFGLILLLPAFLIASVALIGCPPRTETDEAAGAIGAENTAAVGGAIEITGSSTVLPIATAWARAYYAASQDTKINVSGGGSGNGIKALMDGITDIAISSREIKDSELQFARQNNVEPVEHVIGYDGIALIVHPDNSIERLSIKQLSDIFSGEVVDWSELGVMGMANDHMVVVSRDSASGTYESFKEIVISLDGMDENLDYSPASLKKGSNKDIRHTVAASQSAIGYIGLGYIDESIRVVPVVPLGGKEAVHPTVANVRDGSYPVARPLYMYTNGEPTGAVANFLDWGMSEDGQALVQKQGFVPVE